MRKLYAIAAASMLVMAGCLGGDGNQRTVLVDFSHDEFASAMFDNFPGEVKVPQGAEVIFKQIWTGEPHTVTGGTIVNDLMKNTAHWDRFFTAFDALNAATTLPNPDEPGDVTMGELWDAVNEADDKALAKEFTESYQGLIDKGVGVPPVDDEDTPFSETVEIVEKESDAVFEEVDVPWAFDENEDGAFITQNAGQPCYLTEGTPPKDAEKPCADADQKQPVFDGKASYYNSGIIPYEGQQGNTFAVQLSDDIEPGDYWFYCAVHGPGQATKLNVVEEDTEVPSQEAVNRKAREEIDTFAAPMLKAFRDARDGEIEADGETLEGPFAGLSVPVHGILNEFVPKRITTEVGEPVTWKVMGADHTISFDVPEYFPIVEFRKNGEVRLNPKLQPPAGGSPDLPESEEEGPPGSGPRTEIDAGTYDGTGFWSSGMIGGEPFAEYTLRFSKPGSYRYACLIHPPMVGTVEVT